MVRPLALGALLLASVACTGEDPDFAPGDGTTTADGGAGDAARAASFTLSALSAPAVLFPNGRVEVPVEITRTDGFAGAVSLAVQPLPEGVGVAPLVLPETATKGTLVFTALAGTAPIVTQTQVVATAEANRSDTKDLAFVVRGAPGTAETAYGDRGGLSAVENFRTQFAAASGNGVVLASATSVLRVGSDGRRDMTFGGAGQTVLRPPAGATVAVRVMADGSIFVFTHLPASASAGIHRLRPTGEYDATYGADGVVTYPIPPPLGQPYAIDGDVDDQGRALFAVAPAATGRAVVPRFSPTGVLEASLPNREVVYSGGIFQRMIAMPDAALLFGAGRPSSGAAGYASARVMESALATVEDSGFRFRKPVVNHVVGISQDRVLVAGHAEYGTGSIYAQATILRTNRAGMLDKTFLGSGLLSADLGQPSTGYATFAVALEDDGGKVLAVGRRDLKLALARYDSEGNPDPSFALKGLLLEDAPGDEVRGAYLQSIPTVVVVRNAGSGGATTLTRYWR